MHTFPVIELNFISHNLGTLRMLLCNESGIEIS